MQGSTSEPATSENSMKLDQLNDPIVHSDGWIVDPTLTGNLGSSQMRNAQRSSRIGVLKCKCIASDVGSIDVGTASRCLNHMAVIYPRHTHQATGPLPQPRAKTNVGDNLITSTTRTSSTAALLHRRTLLNAPCPTPTGYYNSDPSPAPIRGTGKFIRLDKCSCWAQCC